MNNKLLYPINKPSLQLQFKVIISITMAVTTFSYIAYCFYMLISNKKKRKKKNVLLVPSKQIEITILKTNKSEKRKEKIGKIENDILTSQITLKNPKIKLSNLKENQACITLVNIVNDLNDLNKSVVTYRSMNSDHNSIFLGTSMIDYDVEIKDNRIYNEEENEFETNEQTNTYFHNNLIEFEGKEQNYLETKSFRDEKIDIQTEMKGNLKIIQKNDFLLILKRIHKEINGILYDLYIDFTKERRGSISNMERYISIINFYNKNKESIFLESLSYIMRIFSITQKLLDNSIYYYITEIDENDEEDNNNNDNKKENNKDNNTIKNNQSYTILKIKKYYNSIRKAGHRDNYLHSKKAIIPSQLTKNKLIQIIKRINNIYNEYKTSSFSCLNEEMLDYYIYDKVFIEFGVEKNIILKAVEVNELKSDCNYSSLLKVIEKEDSFDSLCNEIE